MLYEFEIITVKWHHNRGDYIFALLLGDNHDFDVPDGSVFGDVAVYRYKEIGQFHYENGAPRFDIFLFQPVSMTWLPKGHFKEGQRVTLTTQ